jgi:6-phosphogluconolactonase
MCVFNDQGSMCYVVCELSNTIEVFRCDDRGVPEHHIQSIGTVPSGVTENSAAHVQLVVDDTILAVSNRGHDSITFFRVRPDGKLFHLYAHPCSGATPRAFFLADDASWMAIAYQDSDLVEICDVELDILKVTTRMLIPVGSPVSLVSL